MSEQSVADIKEKIKYIDIMNLGFKEEIIEDKPYLNKFGYDYAYITKKLTKRLYLQWEKDTRLCEMVRIDGPKECNVKKRMQIKDLDHLKEIIDFFSDKVVNREELAA